MMSYSRNRSQKQVKTQSKKGHRKETKHGEPPKVTKAQFYDAIEDRIGSYKTCNYGYSKGSRTGVKHEGSCNVSIRDFELSGINYDDTTGEIVFEEGSDGLQDYCRVCSKRCRNIGIEEGRRQKYTIDSTDEP